MQCFLLLYLFLFYLFKFAAQSLTLKRTTTMDQTPQQKNIVYGTITAGGNVHIGDIIYNVAQDFQHSILFLKIENTEGSHYALNLSIKSKHATKGRVAASGENLLREAVQVTIPSELIDSLAEFQTFRRNIDAQTRYKGIGQVNPSSVQAAEARLAQLIFQTFFAGEIGQVCLDFIGLLQEQRIKELLLAIACDDATIINLPFEMVLPHFFPTALGATNNHLATAHFGLVRTKTQSLGRFEMQGKAANAAPLKMLFITALPEDLAEGGKLLQIEEEQTRLIGAIEAMQEIDNDEPKKPKKPKKPKIVIEFLENASLNELDKALKERHHDIVHISGHGAFKLNDKKGVLYFENDEGDEQQITGAQLGTVLAKHGCVKLLLLSACETAIAGAEGGVTEQVADCGVPTILAMRFTVTDEGAKVFTTDLYHHLSKGDTVTQAIAYARDALHEQAAQKRHDAPQTPYFAEWFTPVVYQNQYAGSLIDKQATYHLPDNFYPLSRFEKTGQSRLIGEGFIGRKGYLIQMRQAFRGRKHIVLQGLGGLGKTTLAEAFAHNYDNHSHKVIIFRNGHHINEKYILDSLNEHFAKIDADSAAGIQKAIDSPQVSPTEKLQKLIVNYLYYHHIILIFDNFEDVQISESGNLQAAIGSAALAEFMVYFSDNTPTNCHLIFTTRYTIPDLADTTRTIVLNKMGYAEQYRLLNYSEILRGIPLTDREEVYARLDGHPRGYEFLEALIKKDKTFRWEQVRQAETQVFENLLLAKVYERLSPEEQYLFQVAAVFITTTPLEALKTVYDQKPKEEKKGFFQRLFSKSEKTVQPFDLKHGLSSLSDWSLLFFDEKRETFDVHRLTREWMSQNVTPSVKIKEWAFAAGKYFEQNSKSYEDVELSISYFEIAEAWEDFADVSFRLQNQYQLIGLNQRALELNRAVLGKNVEERSIGKALFNMGAILNLYGQNEQALELYKRSLAIRQQIGDRQGEGATLNNIGQVYKVRGDYDTALRYWEQSLAIQQQIGDRQGEGVTLNNLATTVHAKGDYDTALPYLEQSLVIQQQIGDRRGEGVTLSNISQIYHDKGDYDTTLHYLEQSLAIQQQIGDRQGEGTTLNNISQIYSAKGDYDTTLRYLEQSLAIVQQIGDRQGKGTTLNNLATAAHAKGDYDTALRYLKQSLVIQQQIGDRYGMAKSISNIGAIHFMQNKIEEAFPLLIQGYLMYQELGSPDISEPASFLSELKEKIGEAVFDKKVQEILSKMG